MKADLHGSTSESHGDSFIER